MLIKTKKKKEKGWNACIIDEYPASEKSFRQLSINLVPFCGRVVGHNSPLLFTVLWMVSRLWKVFLFLIFKDFCSILRKIQRNVRKNSQNFSSKPITTAILDFKIFGISFEKLEILADFWIKVESCHFFLQNDEKFEA